MVTGIHLRDEFPGLRSAAWALGTRKLVAAGFTGTQTLAPGKKQQRAQLIRRAGTTTCKRRPCESRCVAWFCGSNNSPGAHVHKPLPREPQVRAGEPRSCAPSANDGPLCVHCMRKDGKFCVRSRCAGGRPFCARPMRASFCHPLSLSQSSSSFSDLFPEHSPPSPTTAQPAPHLHGVGHRWHSPAGGGRSGTWRPCRSSGRQTAPLRAAGGKHCRLRSRPRRVPGSAGGADAPRRSPPRSQPAAAPGR